MKRRAHKDPVTPEMRAAVFARDGYCTAPLVDDDCGPCDGRSTLEHVKSEHRYGVRAPSDMAHLVALCSAHTEDGMKAGAVWNLSHRDLLRDYLIAVAP